MSKLLLTVAFALVLTFPTTSHSDPILVNFASRLALDVAIGGRGDRIASALGPSRVGHYDDGSVAIVASLGSFIGRWYSDVYFNGDIYTYLYGIEDTLCGNCDSGYYLLGASRLMAGEFVGHRPDAQWGSAAEYDSFRFTPVSLTDNGFTFGGGDASIFYLLSTAPPALTGQLIGHYEIGNGRNPEDPLWGPPLSFTATMPVYVPEQMAPVPEPGSLSLLALGLGALIAKRARKK